MSEIQPFNDSYPLNFDFLTPLSLQTIVDPKRQIFYFRGEVSETTRTRITKPIKTDLGIIGIKDTTGRRTVAEYGDPKPNGGDRLTQKEIFEDIQDNTGVPDVVTRIRGTAHPIPREFQEFDSLQGADEIWHEQVGRANRTSKLRKEVGLMLWNPYHGIKKDLFDKGILNTGADPVLKRMKSALVTEVMVPSNNQGYEGMNRENILEPLEEKLIENSWWADTGRPKEFVIRPDGESLVGRLYKLVKRGVVIGI